MSVAQRLKHEAIESSFFEEQNWLDGSVRLPPVPGEVAECDSCSILGAVDLLPKEGNKLTRHRGTWLLKIPLSNLS